MRYYFFLSYARGDEDALVRRFFDDLCSEVRLKAGEPRTATVGFLDQEMTSGERWQRKLTDALAQSGCFLALMTPAYFKRDPCGREWQIFADRLTEYEASRDVDTNLLKPILWTSMPAGRIHPVAAPLQYSSTILGDTYQRLGVRQMLRLERHRDDYRLFLEELAAQIVDSVEANRMPPDAIDRSYAKTLSAFHEYLRLPSAAGPPADLHKPLLVHFILAATSSAEISAVRRDTSYYGANAASWAPFRPTLPSALAELAVNVAGQHDVEARVADLAELAQRSDIAARFNQIVVLLVDAWVTKLEPARAALAVHGQGEAGPVTAVLIPANREDGETRTHWPDLSRSCREIFDRLTYDDELYKSAIHNHQAFELHLPEVLTVAKSRLYASGIVHRPIGGSVDTEPPIIDIPYQPSAEEEP